MKFDLNKKYTLLSILTFLLIGLSFDIPFVNYVWYLFFFKGIAGILLIIVWFQFCQKFNNKRTIEAMGVLFSGIIYIFFITILQEIEIKNNGIKTNGVIQNFKRSRRDKTYGSYQVIFKDKKGIIYDSSKVGKYGIYEKNDVITITYSERIPEINRAD